MKVATKAKKSLSATILALRKTLINDWVRIVSNGSAVNIQQAVSISTHDLILLTQQTKQIQVLPTGRITANGPAVNAQQLTQ